MAFGLFWLVWILFSTVTKGIDGMSLNLFTEMTPPPNTEGGGLANAIVGSGLLILWATVIGTPLGILAGIYLAEYGRKSWLASVTRFINDILLSSSFYCGRAVRLHHRGCSNAAFLGLGRGHCISITANSNCHPHDREYVEISAR